MNVIFLDTRLYHLLLDEALEARAAALAAQRLEAAAQAGAFGEAALVRAVQDRGAHVRDEGARVRLQLQQIILIKN